MSDEAEIAEEATQEDAAAASTRFGMLDAGDGVLHASVDTYLAGCAEARADGFGQLIDLTAVDYLTYGAPRNLPDGVEAEVHATPMVAWWSQAWLRAPQI